MERAILIFRIGGRRFGLEATLVERVVRMVEVAPLPRAPGVVHGVIDVGGEVVPVFDLRRRLDLARRAFEPEDFLVLTRASGRPVALAAEEIKEVMEPGEDWVDKREIDLAGTPLAGVVRTPDGLILIQDLDTFLFRAEEEELEEALRDRADR